MKTVIIFIHLISTGEPMPIAYETRYTTCYEAERAALNLAYDQHVESGVANMVSLGECK